MTAIETTLSFGANFIPRTPVLSLPLNILTSFTENLIALPISVVNKKSMFLSQIRALTKETPSGNFMAIFPLDLTFVKSDNAFLLTPPLDVANTICKLSQSSSAASTGIIAAIETP